MKKKRKKRKKKRRREVDGDEEEEEGSGNRPGIALSSKAVEILGQEKAAKVHIVDVLVFDAEFEQRYGALSVEPLHTSQDLVHIASECPTCKAF